MAEMSKPTAAHPASVRLSDRQVAFVRNVMVGRAGLTRQMLVAAVGDAGGAAPRSYLSTGNVSFTADSATLPALVERLESSIAATIGRHEPVFVRSIDRLADLAAADWLRPYDDAHERCVTFLPPGHPWSSALPVSSRRGDVTLVAATRDEVFSVTRLVGGRPGTVGPIVENALGVAVTTRNWNTIIRVLRSPC